MKVFVAALVFAGIAAFCVSSVLDTIRRVLAMNTTTAPDQSLLAGATEHAVVAAD